MLRDVICGRVQPRVVLIEDTHDVPGRHLVISFLHSLCQRMECVVLLAYERPPDFFLATLPEHLKNRIQVIDCMKYWTDNSSKTPQNSCQIISSLLSRIQGSKQLLGVVIDSVTTLIQFHSSALVPEVIHSLINFSERDNKVLQVVALLHGDVHDEIRSGIIKKNIDLHIHLRQSKFDRDYGCVIHHREHSRKLTHSAEDFNIDDSFQVKDITTHITREPVKKTATEHNMKTLGNQGDPAANLTFNLTLKPEEKSAKQDLVLPYTLVSSLNSDSGKILYVPDDADDFDEEDPDEDLAF